MSISELSNLSITNFEIYSLSFELGLPMPIKILPKLSSLNSSIIDFTPLCPFELPFCLNLTLPNSKSKSSITTIKLFISI